ncbi:glycosyltransferase family A protein [Thiotrichales bacterium HSG1]|nr:glycosyltransferase family A protein [Thiotrichales bacterium HSG1]
MEMISVVIIGRNEGQRLVDCIKSVQALEELTEIIYVDSDSTDDSPKRAKELGTKVIVIHPKRPTAAIGRNTGWKDATNSLILFMDGDTILDHNFLKVALPMFTDTKIAAICGHYREIYPTASIYQRVLDLDWMVPTGIVSSCGGIVLMRKSVLEEVDGYNPKLIAGEEPEMCQRIIAAGYTVHRIDQPMILHDLAIKNWSQYWQRSVRTGHAYAEISSMLAKSSLAKFYKEKAGGILWQRESKKNFIRAGAWIAILVFGLLMTIFSWLPLLLSVGLFFGLSLRTSWKNRYKSNNYFSIFLYGLHSQFQHIPIMVGQLSYYYNRWHGKRRKLIEYK